MKLLKNLQIQEIEDWQNNNVLINEETLRLREKCKNAQNIQKALNDRYANTTKFIVLTLFNLFNSDSIF